MSHLFHMGWKSGVKLTERGWLCASLPRTRWQRKGVPGDDGKTAALCGYLRSDPHWTAGGALSRPSTDACLTSLEEKGKKVRKGTRSPRRTVMVWRLYHQSSVTWGNADVIVTYMFYFQGCFAAVWPVLFKILFTVDNNLFSYRFRDTSIQRFAAFSPGCSSAERIGDRC